MQKAASLRQRSGGLLTNECGSNGTRLASQGATRPARTVRTKGNTVTDLPALISGRQLDLLRQAVEIEDVDARTVGMVGYTARLWAQVALPYKDPGDVPEWTRRNGSLTLYVEPGRFERPDRTIAKAYPFGVVPRLLMTWMATEAVRLRERDLVLGPSLASFMRDLGLVRNGNTIRRLREQVQRLSTARLLVMDQRPDRTVTEGFQIATSTELWWTPRDGDNEALWPSTVTLSQEFYDSIVAAPIPVDLRALAALRTHGSGGLPIDIYTWLAHRMSYLRKSTLVPWVLLSHQFGSQYKLLRQFRPELTKQLPKVQAVYPAAKVTVTADGLLLSPSPTPIGQRLPR